MIVYYALGGGLGHLTRARAVIHTLGLSEPVLLLTASPFGDDPRIVGNHAVLRVPDTLSTNRERFRDWLRATLHTVQPTAIYLDVFPAGICGEWDATLLPADVPVYLLARLLRWQRYVPRLPATPLHFDTAYMLEPLQADHTAYLHTYARHIQPLSLIDPPAPMVPPVLLLPEDGPHWLIVHAGSDHETAELLAYARLRAAQHHVLPRLWLVAPQRPAWLPSVVGYLDCMPAQALFVQADMVISAGGFNIMRQMHPYQSHHAPLPFARAFDDQFGRVARYRIARAFTPLTDSKGPV
ncbi:MAG: hypothetical protein HC876_15195 [Chloroflexaceae bacterium]|nr:hypothetical protein [Chloroflexaceae bacterium]